MSLKNTQTSQNYRPFPRLGRVTKEVFLLLILCVLSLSNLSAQKQMLVFPEFTETRAILSTPDGGLLLGGRTGVPAVSIADDATIAKIDPDGDIQWIFNYGGADAEDIVKLAMTSSGAYAFTGFTNSYNVNGTSSDVFVGLVQPNGDLTYVKSLGGTDSDRGRGIAGTSDGGVIVTGCLDCFDQSDLYLTKLDAAGNVEWAYNNYNTSYTAEGFAVIQTQDGGYAVTGTINQGGNDLLFLLKTDSNGNEIWQQSYGGAENDEGADLIEAANGDLIIVGMTVSTSLTSEDIYLLRTYPNGVFRYQKTYGTASEGDFGEAVVELPTGELMILGTTWSYGAGNGDTYLIKTDALGGEIWSRTYGTLKEETGRSLQVREDGSFLMTGVSRSYDNNNMLSGSTGMVIHADENGLINDNYIKGNVFHDLNANCAFQAGEPGLVDWMVKLDGTEEIYTTTDADGNYEFVVPAGNYELSLISDTYNWEPCLAPFNILIQGSFDTLYFDLPVSNDIPGSYLEVDVSSASVTACTNQTYYINYCNKGSISANDAKVEVELDPYFTFVSSSIPGVLQSGLVYSFDLNNVDSRACGSFEVEVAIDCGAPLGLTHCMSARAIPNTIDLPIDPNWDGSSLELSSECRGDSIQFVIKNIGLGDMVDVQNFIIMEDDLMSLTGPVDLEPGASDTLMFPSNGSTYRIELEQAKGHPGKSKPSSTIEACGLNSMASFSLGYVTQFSEDDANFFVSIDCQENALNFIPQEKRGYPKGTESQHYIDPNEDLEYHIRFQNTLPEMVQTLVIRDTLSPFVDITSVRAGASSHSYDFEAYGDRIVKFTLSNINLPPNASGFVKFRVSQLADNPPGTIITNSSAVYLDYHVPLFSPEIFHTIRDLVVYNSAASEVCMGDSFMGTLYTESAIIFDTVHFANYDSITVTQLTVHPNYEMYLDTTICQGDVFRIGTYEFAKAGAYVAGFFSQNGCDSLININLKLNESPLEFIYEEICEGDSIFLGGNIYTEEGKYVIIKQTEQGCDSTTQLTIKVLNPERTQIDTAIVAGAFYENVLIQVDTTFEEIYTAANGCDSIVTINVDATNTPLAPLPANIKTMTLFPNPTSGDFVLEYELTKSEDVEIRLYHSLGNLVDIPLPTQHLSAGQHSHRLSLANASPGAYMLWIRTSGGTQIRKVIKWD